MTDNKYHFTTNSNIALLACHLPIEREFLFDEHRLKWVKRRNLMSLSLSLFLYRKDFIAAKNKNYHTYKFIKLKTTNIQIVSKAVN